MPYIDRILICRDCGSSFAFTAGEQTFFASRRLTNEPSRCSSCRNSRKAGGATAPETYVHYGAAASFGGRTARQMHPTMCSACQQMTEVPFLPIANRPVLCSQCFALSKDQGQHQSLSSHG